MLCPARAHRIRFQEAILLTLFVDRARGAFVRRLWPPRSAAGSIPACNEGWRFRVSATRSVPAKCKTPSRYRSALFGARLRSAYSAQNSRRRAPESWAARPLLRVPKLPPFPARQCGVEIPRPAQLSLCETGSRNGFSHLPGRAGQVKVLGPGYAVLCLRLRMAMG